MSHAVVRISEVEICCKINVKLRNVTEPLKKYEVIYYHTDRFNNHTYSDVCYFTHKETVFNNVYFSGYYDAVLEGVRINHTLQRFHNWIQIDKNNIIGSGSSTFFNVGG